MSAGRDPTTREIQQQLLEESDRRLIELGLREPPKRPALRALTGGQEPGSAVTDRRAALRLMDREAEAVR